MHSININRENTFFIYVDVGPEARIQYAINYVIIFDEVAAYLWTCLILDVDNTFEIFYYKYTLPYYTISKTY